MTEDDKKDEDESRFVGTEDSVTPLGKFKRTEDESSAEDKRNRERAEEATKE